jgi:hypothetical protein
MARIPKDASANTIEQCIENAQAAVGPHSRPRDQQIRMLDAEDGIINLGDAVIALSNQVRLLNEAVRHLDDRHVSLPIKTRSAIRIWMEDETLCPDCQHLIRFSDNEAGRCEKIIGPSDAASLCGHICRHPDEPKEGSQ